MDHDFEQFDKIEGIGTEVSKLSEIEAFLNETFRNSGLNRCFSGFTTDFDTGSIECSSDRSRITGSIHAPERTADCIFYIDETEGLTSAVNLDNFSFPKSCLSKANIL